MQERYGLELNRRASLITALWIKHQLRPAAGSACAQPHRPRPAKLPNRPTAVPLANLPSADQGFDPHPTESPRSFCSAGACEQAPA